MTGSRIGRVLRLASRRVAGLRSGLVGLVAVTIVTVALHAQVSDRPEVALQAAIKQALVEGDLTGAIEQFKQLAEHSNPAVASEALLQLAAAYDKRGAAEVRGTYERIVRQFPNQTRAAAEARAWFSAHGVTPAEAPGVRVEQVWADADANTEGLPAPDGSYVTFIDWSSGLGNLGVRDLRTGQQRLLTRDADPRTPPFATAGTPVPSPDGKQIAYLWYGEPSPTIRLINADGSNMRVLRRDWDGNYLNAWSPDGQYLAATHENDDRTRAIVLISTKDGSTTQLKSPGVFSLGGFSPDGRFLVYAKSGRPDDRTGGVFALAVDGSREVTLVEGASQGFEAPVWTPDGNRVFFLSDRSGRQALWSVRVTGGRSESTPELAPVSVGDMRPMGFTREGSLYLGVAATRFTAYVAAFDPDTLAVGAPAPVTDRFVDASRFPSFSPDGKMVAFIGSVGDRPVVMLRTLETGVERELTRYDVVYGAQDLQWFPDSRSLLITANVDGRVKRFRQVDIDSGVERILFDAPWSVWSGALSRDGRFLFYSIGEETAVRLVKRRLDTGEETELYRTPPSGPGLFGLSVSPDGTQLAFALNLTDDRALMLIPANGGEAREIYRSGLGGVDITPSGAIAWTGDGRHLVATCIPYTYPRTLPNDELCAVPVAGGGPKLLGVSMPVIPTRMVTGDGTRIAFTSRTPKQELWVIRNLLTEPAGAR